MKGVEKIINTLPCRTQAKSSADPFGQERFLAASASNATAGVTQNWAERKIGMTKNRQLLGGGSLAS